MKTFYWILIALFISSKLRAQQVIKVDCCVDVGTKATIIINDNTTSTTASSSPTNNATVSNGFNFTLTASANTSAGVYNSSDVLVRTLWSGTRYDLGCYSGQWDGLLDDGTPAPYGNYVIKVQSNNETQTWEGGIGNTSDVTTGPFIHGGSHVISCMAFDGTTGYYSMAGSEGNSSQHRFAISNPLRKSYADDAGSTIDADHVCTDGNYIYWSGVYSGSNPRSTAVFAERVSDHTKVAFSTNSFTKLYGNNTYSLIDTVSLPNVNGQPAPLGEVRGLAINSNYLFVSRPGLNRLDVLNKTTGQLLQKLTIQGAGSLACTADSKIWVASQLGTTTVTQYIINNDGTLTATGLSIPCGNNTGLAISPTNGELAVADATTEQVKFYNISGTITYTLGQLNGYATSSVVTYDKFMFIHSFLGGNQPYIAYQPDGSFWLGDAGNYRNLHYNPDKTYNNQIAFVPSSRMITSDINDPTRVFSNFLEFKRDYSKTLDNGANGSWKLQNSWFYGKNGATEYDGLFSVATLSNGRTYSVGPSKTPEPVQELTSAGLRNTGVFLNADAQIRQDGSLEIFNNFQGMGLTTTVTERALTGFDNNNNPQWASPTTFVTTEGFAYNLPVSDAPSTVRNITANPVRRIFWNGSNFMSPHLAATKRGASGTYLWKSTYGTNNSDINTKNNYWRGDYPRDGSIDVGNDKNPDIANTLVYGDNVFWHDHGEFWKASGTVAQVNIWNHYNGANGLLIGNFGVTGYDAFLYGAGAPMMAGNGFSTAINKVGNDYYIYHCDESWHSFIHSWKISNVNSLQVQNIPVTVTAPVILTTDPANLMAGLPYRDTAFHSSNGWTVYPNVFNGAVYYPGWFVATSLNSNATNDIDITFYADGGGSPDNKYITRTLGSNNTNNWTLSGYVYLQSRSGQVYFETLDAAGKILTQFVGNGGTPTINSTAIVSDDQYKIGYGIYPHWQHYIVKNINGTVTFQYANYPIITLSTPFETGGNFNTPAKFRVRSFGQGQGNGEGAVKGLRFVAGYGL